MVQVTFDTNNDSLAELEQALRILQSAVERRAQNATQSGGQEGPVPGRKPKLDMPAAELIAQAEEELPQEPASSDEDLRESGEAEEEVVPEEKTALDAGFLKITLTSDEHKKAEHKRADEHKADEPAGQKGPERKAPTLNQLLHDNLTEEELAKMLGQEGAKVADAPKTRQSKGQSKEDPDAYIEIVEYADEK